MPQLRSRSSGRITACAAPSRSATTCSSRRATDEARREPSVCPRALPVRSTCPAMTLPVPTKRATKAELGNRNTSSGRPCCTMRPSAITATMSPRRRASSKSWVTWSVVMPSASCSARSSRRSTVRVAGSTAAKGSSSSSTAGPGRECPRNRDSLLFAAAQAAHPAVEQRRRCRAARRARAPGRVAASPAPSARPAQAVGDVLAHRQVRKEVVLLVDDAESSLLRRQPGHVLAMRPHPSREQRRVPRDGIEQRRLAAAGGPDDEGVTAGRHLE